MMTSYKAVVHLGTTCPMTDCNVPVLLILAQHDALIA